MKLSLSFLAPYYARGDNFPNLLARSVYLSKYCRGGETWTDTIRRVVEGNVALDPAVSVAEAEALFDAFWNMKILPSGRGLFTGGVAGIPTASRVNCWYMTLRAISDWEWQCNRLLEGGGVGVGLGEIDLLPSVVANPRASLTVLCSKSHPNEMECMPDEIIPHDSKMYIVADTREGWASALRAVLEAAFSGISITVNVSGVRGRGEPIRTFGGVAPGPGPLVTMLRNVWSVVRPRAGGKLDSVDCLDIVNMIGSCIRSGGIRRSAIIQFGEVGDRGFREAKRDYAKLISHRSSSNNSILFRSEHQIDSFDWKELVDDCAERGEPGFYSLWLARQTDDSVEGGNPCQPGWATVLTRDGIRTFDDIDVGSVIWSGERWTKVTAKWCTGEKPVYNYHTTSGSFIGTENHRIVQKCEKIEVRKATSIDWCEGPFTPPSPLNPQDVMDGLVLGDGTVHKASGNLVLLCVGTKDTCYFESEIAHLVSHPRPGIGEGAYEVFTTVTADELPKTYERTVPTRFFRGDAKSVRGFLRGLYSANGYVVGNRVTLKSASKELILQVQVMLASLGIKSYYTTNRATDVEFANGTYTCKESYDLNITQHRRLFVELIGFLHAYKNDKIVVKDSARLPLSCNISSVTSLGIHKVYDITVESEEHTYWTGGLLVSNCLEATLANYDSCNLSNAFPSRFDTGDDYQSLFVLITRYTLRQRLESFVDPAAEAVRARYMRIGVGLGGLCDFDWTRASLSQMYRWVREEATHYAHELGVNTPRTCTVVKPDGSVGTMVGTSSGVHAAFAPFYVRRIRIMDREPMHAALVDAGVPYEQCVYDASGHTSVFEIPMRSKATVYTSTESVTSQIERVVAVQESYTDQMVSSTISFGENEKQELENNLRKYGKRLKGMSMLPRGHTYEQSPYTECTEEEYAKRVSTIREDHPLKFSDDAFEIDCGTGAVCPVR